MPHRFQNSDWSLWENATSHLTYYLSKQFPDVFMVSLTIFKSFLTQQDVYFENHGPI